MKTFELMNYGLSASVDYCNTLSTRARNKFQKEFEAMLTRQGKQYMVMVDARLLARIAVYKLKTTGMVSTIQREHDPKKVDTIARFVARVDETGVSTGLRPGHWSMMLAVSSKMISADGKHLMIPETEEEIEKYAAEFDVIDAQHRILALSDNALAPYVGTEFLNRYEINLPAHIIIDATEQEKGNVFLEANYHSTRVAHTLSRNIMFTTGNVDPNKINEAFAYDVVMTLAKSPVDMGEELGTICSPIYGNVDLGKKEGTYKADKLMQALTKPSNDLLAYYQTKYNFTYAALSEEEKAMWIRKAASDVAKMLKAWSMKNAANGGTESVFGSVLPKPKAKAVQKVGGKILFETPEVVLDASKRCGGLIRSVANYIFATVVASMKYMDEMEMTLNLQNAQNVVGLLLDSRFSTPMLESVLDEGEMPHLEVAKIGSSGGSNAYDYASADCRVLLARAARDAKKSRKRVKMPQSKTTQKKVRKVGAR